MTLVPSKRFEPSAPYRFWECQSAIGPVFEALAKATEPTGWAGLEDTAAIAAAANDRAQMRSAEKNVSDLLHEIRERSVKI